MLQHAISPMKHLMDGSRDAGCKDGEHRRRSRTTISKKRTLQSLKIGSPGFLTAGPSTKCTTYYI